jgi:type I restriction enzyme S subunit
MDFTPAERAVFSLRAGDIVLTEASGSPGQVGRAALWPDNLPDYCYQNTVIRFRPSAVVPEYGLVVFRYYATSGIFSRVARGVGIQHLGATRFAGLQFPLPPLSEQQRIANAVGKRLEELREAAAHIQSALEGLEDQRKKVLATSISGESVPSTSASANEAGAPSLPGAKADNQPLAHQHEHFRSEMSASDDPDNEMGTLPRDWTWIRVDQAGEVRLGRQRSPDKHTGEHATKYLRSSNITSQGLDLTEILEMDFTPAERALFSLRVGDVLLTEASGSSSQVARAAIWSGELPECCYQNHIIRFRPSVVTPEYALLVFRHYAASGIFGRLARGVGIQHLGAGRFAKMRFPLPPATEQKRIADAVGKRLVELREASGHLHSALDRLPDVERELLAAAVSGELVPQMTEDESAPRLLERFGLVQEKATASLPLVKIRQPRGDIMKPKHSLVAKGTDSKVDLSAVLRKAGRPLPLPELFAFAGFDRDQPEQVELFYLALRSELDRTIRRTGDEAENATLEVIGDAP